ncbi:MAG: hypothetical protein V1922_02900 [bacterium]
MKRIQKNRRGEIATIIALVAIVILGVTTIASSLFIQSNKKQSTSTKAAEPTSKSACENMGGWWCVPKCELDKTVHDSFKGTYGGASRDEAKAYAGWKGEAAKALGHPCDSDSAGGASTAPANNLPPSSGGGGGSSGDYCPDGGVRQGNGCDYGKYDAGMEATQNKCLIDKSAPGGEEDSTCWSYSKGCYKTAYDKKSQNDDGSWGPCHFFNAAVCRRGDMTGGCAGVCNSECCSGGQKEMKAEEYDKRNAPGTGGSCWSSGNAGTSNPPASAPPASAPPASSNPGTQPPASSVNPPPASAPPASSATQPTDSNCKFDNSETCQNFYGKENSSCIVCMDANNSPTNKWKISNVFADCSFEKRQLCMTSDTNVSNCTLCGNSTFWKVSERKQASSPPASGTQPVSVCSSLIIDGKTKTCEDYTSTSTSLLSVKDSKYYIGSQCGGVGYDSPTDACKTTIATTCENFQKNCAGYNLFPFQLKTKNEIFYLDSSCDTTKYYDPKKACDAAREKANDLTVIVVKANVIIHQSCKNTGDQYQISDIFLIDESNNQVPVNSDGKKAQVNYNRSWLDDADKHVTLLTSVKKFPERQQSYHVYVNYKYTPIRTNRSPAGIYGTSGVAFSINTANSIGADSTVEVKCN